MIGTFSTHALPHCLTRLVSNLPTDEMPVNYPKTWLDVESAVIKRVDAISPQVLCNK